VKQNSLQTEQIYKNGLQKKVHVVVKNHPFTIQVGLSGNTWEGQKFDFSRYPIEARMVYDTETLKEVSFVKMKPLEFKSLITESGDQVAVELRPKVLTSQLEDMLFRVKIVAVDNAKHEIPNLCVFSEPIKVVSKPEQVKKKKKPAAPSKPKAPPKEKEDKGAIVEMVTDYMLKMENACEHNQNLLFLLEETLLNNISEAPQVQDNINNNSKKRQLPPEEELTPFEKAFMDFISAYDGLEAYQKSSKIRKAIKNSSRGDVDILTEMLEVFSHASATTQPAQPKDGKSNNDGHSCGCNYCPHREELKRIDDFYNRFLITSDGFL